MSDVEQKRLGYRISTDAGAMDLDAIHAYLSVSYGLREFRETWWQWQFAVHSASAFSTTNGR